VSKKIQTATSISSSSIEVALHIKCSEKTMKIFLTINVSLFLEVRDFMCFSQLKKHKIPNFLNQRYIGIFMYLWPTCTMP
jgi:hypothetical protein